MLGNTEQMAALTEEIDAPLEGLDFESASEAFGISVLTRYLWPEGVMPYNIDAGLPDKDRVTDAIAQWENMTDIKFFKSTTEANFVSFTAGDACSADAGHIGGEQFVRLASNCTTGNVIHLIGQTLGLWYEQNRSDRKRDIKVFLENVRSYAAHNFNQHIHDGQYLCDYDPGSINNYSIHFFIKNGQPIIKVKNGEPIDYRETLSDGDIKGVADAYEEEFSKRYNG